MTQTNLEFLKYYSLTTPYPSKWTDPSEYQFNNEEKFDSKEFQESRIFEEEFIAQDEPDPLGMGDSVISLAKQNGITVPDDIRLRAKYLISSKRFNPTVFLRDIHSNNWYPELLSGLRWLTQSIEKRSDALKMLVENNFSRFVKAKTTIDYVCQDMKHDMLNQEFDYGISELKSNINDVITKATQTFDPITENRAKAYRLISTLSILEKYKYHFNVPSLLLDCIEKNDHEMLIREYRKCKDIFLEEGVTPEKSVDIFESQRSKIFKRIWKEVEKIIEDYRKNIFQQFSTFKTPEEQHKLICILLELGTTENPILYSLKCQSAWLIKSLEQDFKDECIKIKAAHHQLSKLPLPTNKQIVQQLKKPLRKYQMSSARETSSDNLMWNSLEKMIEYIFIHKFHEFKNYLEIVCKISQGNLLKHFPTGKNGESKHHLIFSPDDIFSVKKSAEQLIFTLSSLVIDFFISHSVKKTSLSNNNHSSNDNNFSLKPEDAPDLDNKNSSISFIPPCSDSLTACSLLNKLLNIIVNSSTAIFKLNISQEINKNLQTMISTVREMFVEAINVLWNSDSSHFYLLEDWVKSSENPDITGYPKALYAYESCIIIKISELLYIGRNSKLNAEDIIPSPLTKTILSIKMQFLKSLYIALEGLIKIVYFNANQTDSKNSTPELSSKSEYEVNHENIDTRILFTLSNFSHLKNNIIATLLKQFESLYSLSLEDDSKNLYSALVQLDNRLFDDYIKVKSESISQIIKNGILNSNSIWLSEEPPQEIQPYVFDSILSLVVIHSQLSTITSNLIPRALNNLVKSLTQSLLESFQKIDNFGIGGMLQVIIEVEFIKQVLEAYIDEETSNIFGSLYLHLEKAYHHNDNRQIFQQELEKTKNILVNYRKITQLQYSCFKDSSENTLKPYF
ncbi:hypothetical protein PNEG_01689 [Pneumocystis murina B123]|uniref:Exocyst complex component SEC5 n=1 Tax=Pneumocystis murina (strain B123) TaxID=1069680 RepID=M7P7U0_PNEMU|nr:hypothetical protein PNEG_01689 [Pneumocystis murina B123]EMR09930.1 hypothetical protein PNEG_01689 [Pneumocystis murina B123]